MPRRVVDVEPAVGYRRHRAWLHRANTASGGVEGESVPSRRQSESGSIGRHECEQGDEPNYPNKSVEAAHSSNGRVSCTARLNGPPVAAGMTNEDDGLVSAPEHLAIAVVRWKSDHYHDAGPPCTRDRESTGQATQ